MPPTILIAGATGNTGRGVVEALSSALEAGDGILAGHRIIALTRSSKGAVAQRFARLPGVEVVEKNWVDITGAWMRENEVVRAFIASAPEPRQFADESSFLFAALEAGVEYVVRISTTAPNVRPDVGSAYARAHWALEAMLGTPEFAALRWTSLQPNAFSETYLGTAAHVINEYRKTGKQGTVRILAGPDTPVGLIDPYEVGVIAARLLTLNDTAPHNKAKYVVNGPEDVTGDQIVKMVEERLGTKAENVSFNDASFIDTWADNVPDQRAFILSVKYSMLSMQKGLCSASTTSKEVLELAAPKVTAAETLDSMLEK